VTLAAHRFVVVVLPSDRLTDLQESGASGDAPPSRLTVLQLRSASLSGKTGNKAEQALEDRKAKWVPIQAGAANKKARSKTVETSSLAAGGKKRQRRFLSAASERFGKMLRALKTGKRRRLGNKNRRLDANSGLTLSLACLLALSLS
jgi:hypothetical protein